MTELRSATTFAVITLISIIPQGLCGRGLFSPLVEFPEWKPLGRGDPLKDPTNEYLPPVLDKVQYWISGEARSSTQSTTVTTTPAIDRRDTYEIVHIHRYRRPPPFRYRPVPPVMLLPPSLQTTPWPYPDPPTTAWREPTEMTSNHPVSEASRPSSPISALKAILLRSTIEKPSSPSTQSPLRSTQPPMRSTQPPMRSTQPPVKPTTEALYKHYKQPPPPVKSPMYLIIEGHSKVKKYGGTAKLDPVSGIPIQETNEVSNGKSS